MSKKRVSILAILATLALSMGGGGRRMKTR